MTECLDADAYTVGWIAALPHELAAAIAVIDDVHQGVPKNWEQPETDNNYYSWGRIGAHNIVLACLPNGVYGTNPAAVVSTSMLSSFPHIRVGLMVGIGAGVPGTKGDIHLGDVVISKPGSKSGGVVQWDRGQELDDGEYVRTGTLNKPPLALLTALSGLETKKHLRQINLGGLAEKVAKSYPDFGCPVVQDKRPKGPELLFGTIASGNKVVKSEAMRAKIVELAGPDTMCIEMEAAGLMDSFPCLVIRGICDWADSRKNDQWQNYAATTASAAAKELLLVLNARKVEGTKKAAEVVDDAAKQSGKCTHSDTADTPSSSVSPEKSQQNPMASNFPKYFECGTTIVSPKNAWVRMVKFSTKIPPDVKMCITATPVYVGPYNIHLHQPLSLGNCGGFIRQHDGERLNKSFDLCFFLNGRSDKHDILVNWMACSIDERT